VKFVGAILAFGYRRRASVLVVVTLASIACLLLSLRISFGTDVLNLLPQSSRPLQGFRDYVSRFGAGGQLYVLFEVPDGERVGDQSDLIDAYLARIATLPEIERIDTGMFDTGHDWTYVQDRVFALIGPDRTRDALATFTPDGMRAALGRSRELLATPSTAIRNLVQADPLGLVSLLRDHFAGDQSFDSLDAMREGYISADGRSRLAIATPRGAPFDSEFCHRLFARLDDTEVAVRRESDPAPHLKIQYAGGYRIAVETETIIKRESILNGVTSLAAILLLLLVVFRSPWLFLVGAVPMTVATIVSIAVNGLISKHLSAAATGTSALLFGLGIDGLVLLYTRYLEEREHGLDATAAIPRLAGAGTSMMLGCLTTAATFLGLAWIDLPGLQELGRLVGIGMLLGGPLTLILVAALLPRASRRPRAPVADWLPVFLRRQRWPILIGAGVGTVAALPFLTDLRLDLRLQRLQPDTPAVRAQQDLGPRFGVDQDVVLAVAENSNLDILMALDRRFAAEVGSRAPGLVVFGPSRLIPPESEQVETNRMLQPIAARLPALQQELRGAIHDAGFQPDALQGFVDRLPAIVSPSQRLTYDGYIQHGLRDVIARFISPAGMSFTTVSYVMVRNPDDVRHATEAAAAAGSSIVVTGLPIVNAALAQHFRPQFAIGLTIGAVAVFLLMLATFRRVSLTCLALLPTLIGLVWAAAILAWMRVDLDLFSIFAILTLIGIGVDYGIHLVHRSATEPGSLDRALSRVAPANMVAAGIALLGCGSLVTSTYPPLRSLGIVTVVGLSTCLVTAVLVLPALLMVVQDRRRRTT